MRLAKKKKRKNAEVGIDFLFVVDPFRSLFPHRDTSTIEVAEVSTRR